MAGTATTALTSLPSTLTELDPDRVVVHYDHPTDTLMIHFSEPGRPAASVPVAGPGPDLVFERIDRETGALVGLQIESFLRRVTYHHPALLAWLAVADLRGITRAEVDCLRHEREHEHPEQLKRDLLAHLPSDLAPLAAS